MGIGCGSLDGTGMMWEETWELNRKWECWYGNGKEWELGTHCGIATHLYNGIAA